MCGSAVPHLRNVKVPPCFWVHIASAIFFELVIRGWGRGVASTMAGTESRLPDFALGHRADALNALNSERVNVFPRKA
jgi:hypothetical protein